MRRDHKGEALRMIPALCVLALLGTPQQDPLDPLSAAEITAARQVLERSGRLTTAMRFATLTLREPPKDAVLTQRGSASIGRTAEAILYDWATSTPVRAHVDLRRARLIRWDTLPSREPPMRIMIRRRLEEIVRGDSRWAEALRRRGVSDPSLVSLIPALRESAPLPTENGHRVVQAQGFHQEALPVASAVRGIRLRVDLTAGVILELSESRASITRIDSALVSGPAAPPAPDPPASPLLSVSGSEIRWLNWRLRYGVHPRRGLELWDVRWMEGDRARPVLYRASISEAMAAYGDPGYPVWYPRDAGNDGLGNAQLNSAVPLADAPAGAMYADAVMADDFGRPVPVPRAVAIYQRDGGLLWRHSRSGRRARQLVLTSHATIDNYDFTFNWIFGEDGAIDAEVNLTGMMLVYSAGLDGTAPAGHSASSHPVAPGIVAPSHQHFFSYRLDLDLDGARPNRAFEQDTRALPRSRRGNPEGLWFAMEDRALRTEAAAIRGPDPAANRLWRVVNPGRTNRLGEAVGYALVPGVTALPYAAPGSPVRRAGGFVTAQLFITPYHRDEMYAAGEFQNFGLQDAGLPRWTRGNRSLLDADLVLWYTLGVTHIPRPEEYPIMPVSRAGFRLVPSGFFDASPVWP
jgi:primary-amine oxidase